MILVTGATGQVGRATLSELERMSARTRVLIRSEARAADLDLAGIEVAIGDFADPASLSRGLQGVDAVLLVSPLDPQQVELQGNLIDAAVRAGVEHVVKISGLATAPDSRVRSGRWHAETEARLEASGMAWTCLRPPYFFQNLLRLAPVVAASGLLPTTLAPEVRIAMVDVRDVGAVAAHCLSDPGHRGRHYRVTGPAALGYLEVAGRLSALLGRRIEVARIPRDVARERFLREGPAWHADTLLEFDAAFADGDGSVVSPTVLEVTGSLPRDLDSFLSEQLDVFSA